MDDSAYELIIFCGVATCRDRNGFTMELPRGCVAIYTLRDTTVPLVRKEGPPAHRNDLTRPPAVVTITRRKKTLPWLSTAVRAQPVRGVFYNVANRRQANLYIPVIYDSREGRRGVRPT